MAPHGQHRAIIEESKGTHCYVVRDLQHQLSRPIRPLPPLHAISRLMSEIMDIRRASAVSGGESTYGVWRLLIESLCRLLVFLPGCDVDHGRSSEQLCLPAALHARGPLRVTGKGVTSVGGVCDGVTGTVMSRWGRSEDRPGRGRPRTITSFLSPSSEPAFVSTRLRRTRPPTFVSRVDPLYTTCCLFSQDHV